MLTQQILNWLVLCDMKLVIFGGNGILTRRPTSVSPFISGPPNPSMHPVADAGSPLQQSSREMDLLSPPPDRLRPEIRRRDPLTSCPSNSPLPTLKESILRDAFTFHRLSQQFLRKIAMLDRHRRPRGSIEDEVEVTASASQIINDLHQLWNSRPVILNSDFEQLKDSLQLHLAKDISRLLCVIRACFWSNFCYLYRAAWWDHLAQGDERSAADNTWAELRGSVDQPIVISENFVSDIDDWDESPLNSAAMWALFTFATECADSVKVAWCIAKLRQLSLVKSDYGPGGEHASIHAGKAARLLQEVTDQQRAKNARVDVRYISLDLFGFMFPII